MDVLAKNVDDYTLPDGEIIIVPAVSDEEATEKYGSFTTVKPYLRTVPQPK